MLLFAKCIVVGSILQKAEFIRLFKLKTDSLGLGILRSILLSYGDLLMITASYNLLYLNCHKISSYILPKLGQLKQTPHDPAIKRRLNNGWLNQKR